MDEIDFSKLIKDLRKYLPNQAPLHRFVYLNPLQSFEDQSFEEGVKSAAAKFRSLSYQAESSYAAQVASGRIRPSDIEEVVKS